LRVAQHYAIELLPDASGEKAAGLCWTKQPQAGSRLAGPSRRLLTAIKLSRSLSGVEAILLASAPLSQRFILPRVA